MGNRIHILGSAFNMIGGLVGMLGWSLRFARLMLVPKPDIPSILLVVSDRPPRFA